MADYQEAPLATRPKTLDSAEYYNVTIDQRRAEQERATLRAQLKRQYQLQLNNPHRKDLIEDPALTRWTHARTNIYPHFRPTAKTSLLGGLFSIVPLFVLYGIFKTDRDKKEAAIKAGKYERPFQLSY